MNTTQPDPKPVLTVDETAKALGIGRRQTYAAIHAGKIPSVRIGTRILVPRAGLERMLAGDAA